jgi:hypothetical protein
MPNWVTNVLHLTQDGKPLDETNPALLDEIKDYVRGTDIGEDGEVIAFDFNNIVPQPEGLYEQGSVEVTVAMKADGQPWISNMPAWYEWNVEHWGTKWNVSWAGVGNNTFAFDTAWSTPEPVIKALSQKFPSVTFTVEFADEDIGGGNCGTYEYEAGECLGFTEGTEEWAREFMGYEEEDEEEYEEEDTNG